MSFYNKCKNYSCPGLPTPSLSCAQGDSNDFLAWKNHQRETALPSARPWCLEAVSESLSLSCLAAAGSDVKPQQGPNLLRLALVIPKQTVKSLFIR